MNKVSKSLPNQQTILANLLLTLYPPQHLIHVGSGNGIGAVHQWRNADVAHALLIDEPSEPAAWLTTALQQHPNWHYSSAVISANDETGAFFFASNPAESAVIPAETLQPVWPKLKTLSSQSKTFKRLDSLMAEHQLDWQPDWLLIDCLPALPVLHGAGSLLDSCHVVWLRVVLKTDRINVAGATLNEATQFLTEAGFILADITEGNHPAIGEAIFVRHSQPAAEAATEQSENQLAEQHEAQLLQVMQENETLTEQLDDQQALASWQAEQIQALNTQLIQAKQSQDEMSELIAEQKRQLDEQHALASDRLNQITQQTEQIQGLNIQLAQTKQSLDEMSALIAEQKRQLADYEKDWPQLNEQINQLSRAKNEATHRVDTLTEDNNKLNLRLNLLEQELLKAEAQIELIKDLVFK